MSNKVILFTKGDANGTIDSLVRFLKEAKEKGATHYNMSWSNDPMWAFKWFETYRIKLAEEIRNEEIQELEKRLSDLKS